MQSIFTVISQVLQERSGFAERIVVTPSPLSLVFSLLLATLMLCSLYGLAMGWSSGRAQTLSSALKVPFVPVLGLLVCFPVLHVVNVLLGARLSVTQTAALMLFALALNAALLASAAPIAWFFSLGSSYHFMKLLHVTVFALCGLYSMACLYGAFRVVSQYAGLYPSRGLMVFQLWAVVYAFVGTQMAWMLRPFIGETCLPFQWFRPACRTVNFYSTLWHSLQEMTERHGDERPLQPLMRAKEMDLSL